MMNGNIFGVQVGSWTRALTQLLQMVLYAALFAVTGTAQAAQVSPEMARQAAQNVANLHVQTHGDWRGSTVPTIESLDVVEYNGTPVGYLAKMLPAGSMLVAFWDDFSPVIFYSPTYTLNPSNIDIVDSLESWLLPETYASVEKLIAHYLASGTTIANATPAQARIPGTNIARADSKIALAWQTLGVPVSKFSAAAVSEQAMQSRDLTAVPGAVAPLLTTKWDQNNNYRMYTPAGSTCTHTYTGCAATATAQLMKYWNWPDVGQDSHSYAWNDTTLSANFAHAYNWGSMPNQLTATSTPAQNDAVARLMSDIGIAIDMDYGCGGSSAWPYSNNALSTFFRYKRPIPFLDRVDYTSSNWMNLIKTELGATTPRPVLFTIYTTDLSSAHEVVIDGYQTAVTDQVHINYGWSGNADGYYDITNNWTASDDWSSSKQYLMTGIEPDRSVQYKVAVNKTGTGLGAVSSNDLAISCGGTCSSNFPVGTTLQLTAAPWGASQFVDWSGACSGSVPTCTVTVDAAKNVTARFVTTEMNNSFGALVDNKGLFFVTGSWSGGEGVNGWTMDVTQAHTGTESLRSGTIGNSGVSWLDTTVRGPGTLSFAWKVSSEANYDKLRFYLDDGELAAISGEQDWTTATFALSAGQHVLAWSYEKDTSFSAGTDAGWVDSIIVAPFPDVTANSWAANYVNALYSTGITTGCGGGNYCPTQTVTRDQMAAFIIRALEGNPAAGYCGATSPFTDVPVSSGFCGHVKRMLELNITTGCGGGNYCPSQTVTRDQMAAFLARAFLGM